MTADLICTSCEKGKLVARVKKTEQEYKGHKRLLELHFYECNECGDETITAEQARLNQQIMLDFKRSVS